MGQVWGRAAAPCVGARRCLPLPHGAASRLAGASLPAQGRQGACCRCLPQRDRAVQQPVPAFPEQQNSCNNCCCRPASSQVPPGSPSPPAGPRQTCRPPGAPAAVRDSGSRRSPGGQGSGCAVRRHAPACEAAARLAPGLMLPGSCHSANPWPAPNPCHWPAHTLSGPILTRRLLRPVISATWSGPSCSFSASSGLGGSGSSSTTCGAGGGGGQQPQQQQLVLGSAHQARQTVG